jgi:undecaprenyl-diphosphatase
MNEYLLSILLGIIEGLTEFLPVSSTAHLRIAEAWFRIDLTNEYWTMYAIVIQLGAILCLPIYFRQRLREFFATFPGGKRGDRNWLTHPLTLVFVAFVFTAVPSLLLTKIIGKHLENVTLMAGALIAGGAVMWAVDAIYGSSAEKQHTGNIDEVTPLQAVWIGACQTLAPVFPGVSRSMATIAAGQIAGMTRPAALEFSFLLSIPTMAAATVYDFFKFLYSSETVGSHAVVAHRWISLAVGFAVSFIVAYAVVAWFMHWVRRHGFVVFAVYRILFGVAVLIWIAKR